MTTENVTVLFTDMVGSTELASSLSAEAADEVRRAHFAILRQAVAEAGGTEVKNLGDGMMVVFPVASAALACAAAMQQGTERDNRDRERPLGLRVGLSAGEATREGADFFGDPVIEAARLCARCEGGQILAADVVRVMAGRRSRHECRAVGDLELKGLPEPVPTVEVGWEPVGEAESSVSIPLPGRMARRPDFGVVGRASETTTILDALKRVASDGGRELVLVSGEAGLGKTTLVADAARAAYEDGACVLFGHCEEDLATPYQLFGEALAHYVTHAPEDRLAEHVREHGAALARLVPALARRIPELPDIIATDADTERYLLFAAVLGLLAQASRDQPVVLVLDDIQWADKASLVLLRHLAAADHAGRLLVLGTYRDTELSRSHPLLDTLAALRRMSGVSRVDLIGLDDRGVLALLESAAGHAMDDDGVQLAHAVYRETDGNPFFVSEVLRSLAETGAITQDASGRWIPAHAVDDMALPDSVREVIGARVGRLGDRAEQVLSIAAVIGRDFDLDLLARTTEISEDDLLDLLEAAAAAALVREPSDASGGYTFAHAMIQHTLYEDLGPNRRARAHHKIAEALEELCGDRPAERVGELARHWMHASQPVNLAKAIDYARQAGDAALSSLAPGDALNYYAQALDLYPQVSDPEPTLALDLAIGLGTAQRQTGDPAFRDTLIDAARRAADLDDTDRLVAAVLVNDMLSNAGTFDAEKVAVLELALDRLPNDSPERALVLATLCTEISLGGSLERRVELAEEAFAIADACDDDAVVVRVANSLNPPLSVPALVPQLWERSTDVLERAQRMGDPVALFWAARSRAGPAICMVDIEECDRCLAVCENVAEQLDQPMLRWAVAIMRAVRAHISGDVEPADRLATEAFEIGNDAGLPDALLYFAGQTWGVHHQRGSLGDLIPILEQMNADSLDVAGLVASGLAVAYASVGRRDDAARMLRAVADTDFDINQDTVWLQALANFSEVAHAVADASAAMQLHELLVPWADQWVLSGDMLATGPVPYYLGCLTTVLGRDQEAEEWFARSAAMCERMGAKFWADRTNLRLGELLAARNGPGDADKARALLDDAHAAAATNGYGSIERESAEALQHMN